MDTSGCKLIMIKPPGSGYTVKYLRDIINRGVVSRKIWFVTTAQDEEKSADTTVTLKNMLVKGIQLPRSLVMALST